MALTNEENSIVALVASASQTVGKRENTECVSLSSATEGLLPWVTQPLFWKYSREWEELSRGLKHCCPGGGPAVSTLMERFLRIWPLFLKNKYRLDGSSSKFSNKSAKSERNINSKLENEVKMLSTALETVLWEKLHTGIWKDVTLIWRDAYSFSCLITAIVELEVTSEVEERRKKALRCLDLACLMGGPLWRQVVFQFIEDLVGMIAIDSSSIGGSNTTTTTDSERLFSFSPLPLPLLPPGSLGASSLSRPVPRHHLLSLEAFATDYMIPQQPGIVSGAMDTWPALQNWQFINYWRQHAGPRTVPVEVGKNYLAEEWGQKLMLFSDFLDKYLVDKEECTEKLNKKEASECVYLAQHDLVAQIPHLANDIHQPEYCSLGHPVHATNTWIGPICTVTPLHTDPEQNLLCQVVGRKYIRLYSPEQSRALIVACGGGGEGSSEGGHGGTEGNDGDGHSSLTLNTSPVDVDTHPLIDDFEREKSWSKGGLGSGESGPENNKSNLKESRMEYPLYASAPFLDCILESGEMLYIPAGWWHYVKSLSTSASVNFWWRR
jgi:[histone H3]-dimethyl/trimethyl-L-lysine36 demethylase